MPFAKNVFINCPFDAEYTGLLRPLLFTVLYLDLVPRICETTDGGEIRINRIKTLIKESKYSIHDLSRSGRFNMPYELGLDIGCKEFGGRKLNQKLCLILESVRFETKATISDIGGQDLSSHNNDPETLIEEVRNWFYRVLNRHIDPANMIWDRYSEFNTYMTNDLIS